MRTSKLWSFLALSAAVLTTPVVVHAQATSPSANTPAPPQTMRLEEGEAPAVTINPPSTEKSITEKRELGKVKEVKVQTGRTTYYAKPIDPAGAMRGDGQSDNTQPVQFKVGEFGPPKDKPAAEEPQTLYPKK
ncbi:MAG: DUF2782 domain-containing protein [Oxalicibacterium faecigallinarum]|uniref:DUF2782 domain-containing protein n=1 Tax=Oxalicibacterium faecigallinarum TaxID=573741 RepID=UPI002807A1CA|nr:DUF2782 domain-containing protein [Oxalicibacterium faecigallinarum]MDQ7969923.1 DUF2782 domain-containing protein [Oxalicibacterium faecigallinarum]